MIADYGTFKHGRVEFPVAAAPFVDARAALDPALDASIAFYKAMLFKHLGAYFDALVNQPNVGLANLTGAIVAECVAYDPLPYFTSTSYKLPLLALYRASDDIAEHTVSWYKTKSEWRLVYIMPALTSSQANSLSHVLKAVRAIIVDRTEQGYDVDYLDNAEVFADAGISNINVKSCSYGAVPQLDTNIRFMAMEIVINVEEREQRNPGLDDLEGVDASIETTDGDPANDLPVAPFAWENVPL